PPKCHPFRTDSPRCRPAKLRPLCRNGAPRCWPVRRTSTTQTTAETSRSRRSFRQPAPDSAVRPIDRVTGISEQVAYFLRTSQECGSSTANTLKKQGFSHVRSVWKINDDFLTPGVDNAARGSL